MEKEIQNDKFPLSKWFSLACSKKLANVGCVDVERIILVTDQNWFSQLYKEKLLEKDMAWQMKEFIKQTFLSKRIIH